MKPRNLFVLLFILFPCMLQAEVLFLKDGSNLVGKLVRVDGDTLYFQPSFGGTLKFSKSAVLRVQFNESESEASSQIGSSRPFTQPLNSAEPGSLIVDFGGMTVSNKIVVHRKRNYAEHERANAIKSSLIIDGLEVASVIDSTMDKVYRDGPDTYLKNTIKLSDFRVKLEPGPHSCLIVIENIGAAEYKEQFEFAPLQLSLNVDNVVIYPKRISKIEVGKKRGAFRLGAPKLYLKTYR